MYIYKERESSDLGRSSHSKTNHLKKDGGEESDEDSDGDGAKQYDQEEENGEKHIARAHCASFVR